MASENLNIDVTASDGLTPTITNTTNVVNNFTTEVQRKFDRASKATEKMGGIAEIAAKKFHTLAKATVGIFVADIAARVLGFSSALDLVSKAADALAVKLRVAFGLEDSKMSDNLDKLTQKVKTLQEALEETQGLKLTTNFGSRFVSVPNGLDLRYQVEMADQVRATQARIDALEKENEFALKQPNNLKLYEDAKMRVLKQELDMIDQLNRQYRGYKQLQDEIDQRSKIRSENAKSGALFSTFRTDQLSQLGLQGFANAGLSQLYGAGSRIGGAFIDLATGSIVRGDKESPLNRTFAPEGATWMRPMHTNDTRGKVTNVEGDPVQRIRTFGESAAETFRSLQSSIEDSLGSQAVEGAFQSFRGFFSDVITGAVSGAEAFKRFGQTIIASMADIVAQRFAVQALGFFGFGGTATSAANGGVFRGGLRSFAGGGIAYGPQFALIGDNHSQTEAVVPMPDGKRIPVDMRGGGGGHTVNLTLNVGSLDPRGAAQVILANMPDIQAALTDALVTGSDRALRVAVRGG